MDRQATWTATSGDTYSFKGDLGSSGQSQCFIVTSADDQEFVLKEYSLERNGTERCAGEMEALKLLGDEQGFPSLIDSGETDGRPFIVMTKLEGFSLNRIFEETPELDVDTRLQMFGQLLDRLSFAHQKGVYHRDLKPENILWHSSTNELSLIDFGISLTPESAGLTSDGSKLGPTAFLCPEALVIANDLEVPIERFDLYPLGKLLYYILRKGRLHGDKEHHGLFPRELFAQKPWILPSPEIIFQPVLASVITESYQSAESKTVEALRKRFEESVNQYQTPYSPQSDQWKALAMKASRDVRLYQEADKKRKTDERELHKNVTKKYSIELLQKILRETVSKLTSESSTRGFETCIQREPMEIPTSFPDRDEWRMGWIEDTIHNSIALALSTHIPRVEVRSAIQTSIVREVILAKLLVVSVSEDGQREIEVYPRTLHIPNTTPFSTEDMKTHVEEWLSDLQDFIVERLNISYKD